MTYENFLNEMSVVLEPLIAEAGLGQMRRESHFLQYRNIDHITSEESQGDKIRLGVYLKNLHQGDSELKQYIDGLLPTRNNLMLGQSAVAFRGENRRDYEYDVTLTSRTLRLKVGKGRNENGSNRKAFEVEINIAWGRIGCFTDEDKQLVKECYKLVLSLMPQDRQQRERMFGERCGRHRNANRSVIAVSLDPMPGGNPDGDAREANRFNIDRLKEVMAARESQNDGAATKDVLAGQNAKVVSIPELLSMNLQIPDYQRPYEWVEKNVLELLEDIQTAQKAQKKSYRIGLVILRKKTVADGVQDKEAQYDIVDGQQRTVTLILLCSALAALEQDVQVPSVLNKKEFYPSLKRCKVSRRNIHNNFAVISEYLGNLSEADVAQLADAVKRKLEVVVISVDEQSEAFQLFDSQNSRGRRLEPHDLLKAYHLRAAKGVFPTCIDCAVKKWEAHKSGEISALFSNYLYRIYKWGRMEKCESFTTADMAVFKGLPMNGACIVPYAYAQKAKLSRHGFQIGEPIVPGLDFFRMVEHYFGLREKVMDEVSKVEAVFNVWKSYHDENGCAYVEGLFEAALLCYFDRFGFDVADSLLAIRKLFKWAYMVRADLEYLGPKTPNKYALGGDGGYANKYPLFAKILNAREHFEITNLVINTSNDVQSKWAGLNEQLKKI